MRFIILTRTSRNKTHHEVMHECLWGLINLRIFKDLLRADEKVRCNTKLRDCFAEFILMIIGALKDDEVVKTKNPPRRRRDAEKNVLKLRSFSPCLRVSAVKKMTSYEIIKDRFSDFFPGLH